SRHWPLDPSDPEPPTGCSLLAAQLSLVNNRRHMFPRAATSAGAVVLAAVISLLTLRTTSAQTSPPAPLLLRYTFQPDCLRKSLDAPCDTPKASKRLDLGPQIAVWV